jgi:hypothetical protein
MENGIMTKDYFANELEDILHIHFYAKYYIKDVKYLNNPDTSEEAEAVIENHYIKRIRIAFWKLGIIELAKLFHKSKSQHYNLFDYIHSLILAYDTYQWMQGIEKEKLKGWLEELNCERIKCIIHKVCVQRNKYFAHTDKNPDTPLRNVLLSFNDVEELLKLTELIIYDLKLNCLRIDTDFEILGHEKAGNILNAFVALKEKKDLETQLELERDKRQIEN